MCLIRSTKSRMGPYRRRRKPLRPTASAPPTVASGFKSKGTICPNCAHFSFNSLIEVPAPHRTVISSGSCDQTPAGARTSREPRRGSPPTSHWVRPPTTVTGPTDPTSDANWRIGSSMKCCVFTPTRLPGRAAQMNHCIENLTGEPLEGSLNPLGQKPRESNLA